MNTIDTDNGILEYEPIRFEVGQKAIGIEKSKENLLLFKKIMDENNIFFGLIFGTLLGAVRENNFIAHDEDTDVYIYGEDRNSFLNVLFDMAKLGLKVGRYDGELLSLVRDGEYIDVYIFSKSRFKKRRSNKLVIKEKYFLNTTEYRFLDEEFRIPSEYINLLTDLYGMHWRTPIADKHAENYCFTHKIRRYLIQNYPKIDAFIQNLRK